MKRELYNKMHDELDLQKAMKSKENLIKYLQVGKNKPKIIKMEVAKKMK